MCYLFVISFSFFVLILTLFRDFEIFIIVYFIILGIFLFLKLEIRYIVILIVAAVFSVIRVFFYDNNYFKTCNISNNIYVSTGYFTDRIIGNKYVFSSFGRKIYVKVKKMTPILGKRYLVAGYIEPVNLKKTGFESIKYYFESPRYKFDGYLFMKGYCGKLKLVNILLLTGQYHYSIFEQIKNVIRQKVINLYGNGEKGSLLLGILIGDKSFMKDRQYRQYIDSQIVHIVAVSGGNLALVGFLIGLFLFWLPFYIRLVFIFLGISFFVFIVGSDSSIIRAWIMASLAIMALFFGKTILIWRLIAVTLFIMLLYNPYYLPYDLGFLLSFGALIGIIIFNEIFDKFRIKYEKIYDKIREKVIGRTIYKLFKEYIFPTIGATIGVLPILILFVGRINLLGIVANFFVMFVVPIVTFLGIFTLVFHNYIGIQLENYFLLYINFISYWFSKHQLNLCVDNWYIKMLIAFSIYLILVILYFYFTKRFLNNV